MKNLILAAVILAVLAPAATFAHPGHEHKLMGTITTIDGNKVSMKTTEGKDATFAVTPLTTFKNGKGKGAQSDLKVGLRIVVNAGDGAEPMKAKEVQYGGLADDDLPARHRAHGPARTGRGCLRHPISIARASGRGVPPIRSGRRPVPPHTRN